MKLTHEQTQVAESNSANILLIAAAGSGKTTTLIARARKLLETGSAAIITYTNAGANVIRERLSGYEDNPPFVGTIHAYMMRYLHRYGELIGCHSQSLLAEHEAEELLKETAETLRYKGSLADVKKRIMEGYCPDKKPERKADIVALTYQRDLIRNGAIDYDSILTFGHACLEKNHGDVEEDHLLVDEVQDSSLIDHKIFQAMDTLTKFMVGDDRQSIYAFRGARPDLMDTRRSGADMFQLTMNFRSKPEIVSAANSLMSYGQCLGGPMEAVQQDGGRIAYQEFSNAQMELGKIAEVASKQNPGECAILLRTNALIKDYSTVLLAMGVDLEVVEKKTYPPDWELAKLAISLLADPDNNLVASRWVKHLGNDPNSWLNEAMEDFTSINRIHPQMNYTRPEVPYQLYETLKAMGVGHDSRELVKRATAKSTQHSDWISSIIFADLEDTNEQKSNGSVYIGTMHSAKGREWKTVILPAWEQQTFPHTRDLQEERRLAYVAVTRAKKYCLITSCNERYYEYRGKEQCRPSQFIAELEVG